MITFALAEKAFASLLQSYNDGVAREGKYSSTKKVWKKFASGLDEIPFLSPWLEKKWQNSSFHARDREMNGESNSLFQG